MSHANVTILGLAAYETKAYVFSIIQEKHVLKFRIKSRFFFTCSTTLFNSVLGTLFFRLVLKYLDVVLYLLKTVSSFLNKALPFHPLSHDFIADCLPSVLQLVRFQKCLYFPFPCKISGYNRISRNLIAIHFIDHTDDSLAIDITFIQ